MSPTYRTGTGTVDHTVDCNPLDFDLLVHEGQIYRLLLFPRELADPHARTGLDGSLSDLELFVNNGDNKRLGSFSIEPVPRIS